MEFNLRKISSELEKIKEQKRSEKEKWQKSVIDLHMKEVLLFNRYTEHYNKSLEEMNKPPQPGTPIVQLNKKRFMEFFNKWSVPKGATAVVRIIKVVPQARTVIFVYQGSVIVAGVLSDESWDQVGIINEFGKPEYFRHSPK